MSLLVEAEGSERGEAAGSCSNSAALAGSDGSSIGDSLALVRQGESGIRCWDSTTMLRHVLVTQHVDWGNWVLRTSPRLHIHHQRALIARTLVRVSSGIDHHVYTVSERAAHGHVRMAADPQTNRKVE